MIEKPRLFLLGAGNLPRPSPLKRHVCFADFIPQAKDGRGIFGDCT